jgi:uncharacterized protein with LGFP repeats
MKQRKLEAKEAMPKLTTAVSAFSREDSDTKSEHSNKSSKKGNKKKETTLARDKKHKVYVRNQSPRAEESFYDSNV